MMSKKPIERPQTAGDCRRDSERLARRARPLAWRRRRSRHRDPGRGSGVGSGVFTRFSLGMPTPSSSARLLREAAGRCSVSDRDTKKLDEKSGAGKPEEELGLAPLDEEDVLGVANRRPAKKPAACFGQVELRRRAIWRRRAILLRRFPQSRSSGSGKSRSLLEEELHDPEMEQIKRKMAQRAQFNPLQPPNYVPPSSGLVLGSLGFDRGGSRVSS